jgi:hypothetical protein
MPTISNSWRQRLAYIAMSVFVAWHTLAIVVAPAPVSRVTQSLRVYVEPYLKTFLLDNKWDFFAPNVGPALRLRYVIEDKDGQSHTFDPAEQLNWFHPNFHWARSWHTAIMDDPDLYADAAAARLCREHAALNPVAITFIKREEGRFTQADLLSGKSRLDPEFFDEETLKQVKCP